MKINKKKMNILQQLWLISFSFNINFSKIHQKYILIHEKSINIIKQNRIK